MTENNEQLVNQIAIGLETATNLIQALSTEVKDNSKDIAAIEVGLKNTIENVKTLSKILKDGNGVAPVLSRLAVLEQLFDPKFNTRLTILEQKLDRTESFEEDIDQIEDFLEEIQQKLTVSEEYKLIKKQEKQAELEETRYKTTNKLQMWIAIVSSIIAIGAAILGAIF